VILKIAFAVVVIVMTFMFGQIYAENVILYNCEVYSALAVGGKIFDCYEILQYENVMHHSSVTRLWLR